MAGEEIKNAEKCAAIEENGVEDNMQLYSTIVAFQTDYIHPLKSYALSFTVLNQKEENKSIA